MAILSIEINGEELDMYDDEKVVQSFTIINIEDITKRQSEYSNNFKIPRTNKNLRLCEYSDYLNNTSRFPYSKIPCSIKIDGFVFKKGFVQLDSFDTDINIKFFTGNAGFYEILKGKSLKDISVENTPSLLTSWNLVTVVGSRALTTGAFFPLIDYNGMATTGNVVDVRRLLPAYYDHDLMNSCIIDAGYTLDNQITGDTLIAYNKGIKPTSKNKLENDAVTIEINSYSSEIIAGSSDNQYRTDAWSNPRVYPQQTYTHSYVTQYHGFSNLFSGNSFLYITTPNGFEAFTPAISGEYTINYDLLVNAENVHQWQSLPQYEWKFECKIGVFVNGVNVGNIGDLSIFTPNGELSGGALYINQTITGNLVVNLNAGDQVILKSNTSYWIHSGIYSDEYLALFTDSKVKLSAGTIGSNSFGITLNEGLIFGSDLSPSQCLTDIKQSDYFKDTCIRYCLVPSINEDTKVVSLIQFNSIKNNIANFVDWTDKIDETKEPLINFELGNYGQKNNIKHKEDKLVPDVPLGSDTIIGINNQNLEPVKDLYTSPFAASTTVERLGTDKVMYIDSHDGTFFNNDVQPRTGYVRLINRTIAYYDGTTTTTVTTNVPLTWFIDNDRDYSAGFQNSLIENSSDLIGVLQSLKVLTIDIRLNILDILNLNFFYPIYLNQYNAYFFVSQIKQFDYTSNDSTEVELIKLN